MLEDTRLSVGGSVGAIQGNIFEHHFKKVLEQLGYIILPYSLVRDYLREDGSIQIDGALFKKLKVNISRNELPSRIVVWKYRLPPYGFSEIDFYLPSLMVGFWVSCIGRIKRKTCPKCLPKNKATKFNEFLQSKGICPHCKRGLLPNENASVVKKWICNSCNHIVDPLTLESMKCAKCGSNLVEIEDKSASTQAHKQFYYRLAEVLDIKTKSDITCIFIAYNSRDEWRIWHKAFDLFFDYSIFVFDATPAKGLGKIDGLFDSDNFNTQFRTILRDVLKNRPQISDERIRLMFTFIKEIRNQKEKTIKDWERTVLESRKILLKSDEIKCYPIRYSIYYLLKKLKESYKPIISQNQYKQASNVDESLLNEREQLIISQIDRLHNENIEDVWLNLKKSVMKSVLKNYFERARKHKWYKNLMLLNLDYKAINATPFLEQFEPLEELLFIKLKEISEKNKNIIKEIQKEPCFDVTESTIIRKLIGIAENDKGFIIGNDAKVVLIDNKEVVFQCKTSCSFDEWDRSNRILSSGISYKDAKRMIGHNFLASFDIQDNKLVKKDRVFIVVLDGHWGAGGDNKLKNLSLMYLLGVDEIFFADELFFEENLPPKRCLTYYLQELSKN